MNQIRQIQLQDVEGYPHKVLPPGVHLLNEKDINALFVQPFPNSRTRKNIFQQFKLFRELIRSIISSKIWVNGSFVESVENPNDVDVVVLVNAEAYNNLSDLEQLVFRDIFIKNQAYTKQKYLTHAFWEIIYEKGHIYHDVSQYKEQSWREFFGQTRSLQLKGIVCLHEPKFAS
jgi:hypothetical protein